jgi:hypothetical protein
MVLTGEAHGAHVKCMVKTACLHKTLLPNYADCCVRRMVGTGLVALLLSMACSTGWCTGASCIACRRGGLVCTAMPLAPGPSSNFQVGTMEHHGRRVHQSVHLLGSARHVQGCCTRPRVRCAQVAASSSIKSLQLAAGHIGSSVYHCSMVTYAQAGEHPPMTNEASRVVGTSQPLPSIALIGSLGRHEAGFLYLKTFIFVGSSCGIALVDLSLAMLR